MDISSQLQVIAKVVDARNQPCPKPILRTKRALEDAQLGDTLEIIVNDHTSKTNVLGITVLIVLLVGLLLFIVIFGIRLTRR